MAKYMVNRGIVMKQRFLFCVALCAAPVGAHADPTQALSWQFQLTPYIWMSGLSGDVGTLPNGSPIEVDLSFRDVLEDLDIAGMVYGSARNDRWAVFLDATHVSSSATEALGGIVLDSVRVESDTTTFALAVGRTFVQADQMSATAYVGARAWWLDSATELRGVGGAVSRQTSSASWVDPLIGVTGQLQPNDRWSLTGALEVGGFGVGADFEWSALAAATYSVSDWFGVSFGWRHLEVDYSSGDTLFDIRQSGPLLGATFVF